MIRGLLISRFQRRPSPNPALGRRISSEYESDSLCDLLGENELKTPRAAIDSVFSTYSSGVLPKHVQDSTDIPLLEYQKAQSSGDEAEKGSPGDILTINVFVDTENRVGQR